MHIFSNFFRAYRISFLDNQIYFCTIIISPVIEFPVIRIEILLVFQALFISCKSGQTPNASSLSTVNVTFLHLNDVYEIAPGLDLAKVFEITQIYFDLDKSNIRKDAIEPLEKIVEALVEYPNIKIEIGSHTDSRQHRKYNKLLSQRRADATMAYLIKRGIAPERLTAKGYGESQLVNPCADAVPCTEEEHQQNRRSTFVIIGE